MEDIIKRLFEYQKKQHLTQKELSVMLDVSKNTIGNWKNGGSVSPEKARAIEALIMDYAGNYINSSSSFKNLIPGDVSFDIPPGTPVPLLTVAQAAELSTCKPFGDPLMNIKDGAQSVFTNPKPGDFAVIVAGNSMMPWYPPGTQVLVGRDEIPKNGDRVVAMLPEHEVPIFKVFVDLGEEFALVSLNDKEGIPPIRINKMDRSEWYWCWPIKESKRMERDMDNAVREYGMSYPWEEKIKKVIENGFA